ncbi:DUF885 domain-containing protein [Usitatibacter palustris]|uniref:DUF885 domain-containing protein n=1 Tax=Usitatibacter palustris TaxID=2732487 RepID=A0A6M4H371_9PROT|nr:DUF885 domain-containing protein [Usitatibacter palustris]QJR13752.1 hypothetical protein DSM104440_00542 [Usitatibacter palustris]
MNRILASLALAISATAFAQEPAPNAELAKFFEDRFMEAMRESPEQATFVGLNLANDKLSDLTPAGMERRRALRKSALDSLQKFKSVPLNSQDRISRDMMIDSIERAEAGDAFFKGLPFAGDYADTWMPISPIFGIQDIWTFLAKAAPFATPKDYENYVKRLEAMAATLPVLTTRMRAAMTTGWMPPRSTLSSIPTRLAPFADKDPTASPLYGPFKSYAKSIPESEHARLTEAGKKALGEKVNPAFAAFLAFFEKEYLPKAREDIAASTLPGGKAFYAHAVKTQTTTDLTPEQIHKIGLGEVARIRGEMDKVIASTGFKGTFAEFLVFLRSDPRFYYTKSEDLIAGYRDIAKRADAELPKFFAELPRLPYGIRPMEAHEGDNADHYSAGALDGSRAGFYEANSNNLKMRPKYDMEAVLLHETVPGHHLQIARAQELKGLPKFRRSGGYTAFSEGWGLYAESLGYEMGFYKDPYMHFGALSAEMLRACRLVIDTGVHALGWKRDQSIRYLADNSGVHESFAISEVDRYIVWPGQALGYKIGELKIKELRAKATQALGPKFDLRRFHNAVIDDGPLPLNLLEARINEWITKEKGAP